AATYFADIEGIDARLSGEADVISGVRADGDSTVVITLKRPAVNFLSKLTGVPATIVDVESAIEPDWWTSANGSGPFRVESYQAGRRLRMVAYDDFVHGRPRLDSVTILLGSEAVQPMNLYETGRIDVTSVPSWALDRVLAPNDPLHAELVESDQLATTFIALNPNEPPYDDPRFRSLIAHTLDVETLVSVGMDGKVERATGLIPPGTGGSEWPAQAPEHDTERAAGLLAEIDPIETPPTFYEPGGGIGV